MGRETRRAKARAVGRLQKKEFLVVSQWEEKLSCVVCDLENTFVMTFELAQ